MRYVTLPYDAHGCVALGSDEHMQWEILNWFDKYVKNGGVAAAGNQFHWRTAQGLRRKEIVGRAP